MPAAQRKMSAISRRGRLFTCAVSSSEENVSASSGGVALRWRWTDADRPSLLQVAVPAVSGWCAGRAASRDGSRNNVLECAGECACCRGGGSACIWQALHRLGGHRAAGCVPAVSGNNTLRLRRRRAVRCAALRAARLSMRRVLNRPCLMDVKHHPLTVDVAHLRRAAVRRRAPVHMVISRIDEKEYRPRRSVAQLLPDLALRQGDALLRIGVSAMLQLRFKT